MDRPEPRWHVVLVHPDQPGNVGNIGRTCLALGCRLHLVKPCGFLLSDRRVARSGMDYWPQVDLREHASLEAWLESIPAGAQVRLFSTKARQPLAPALMPPGSHLVFGSESAGLPEAVWSRFAASALTIPQRPGVRSLNLASAVALALGCALAAPND